MTASVEALAARAVDGDGAALGEVCRHLEAPIFRLCLRMLGDVAEAEDATQDVLIKIITHLGQFQHQSALATWAHRIAVRHVLALRESLAEQRALDETAFERLIEQGLAYGQGQPALTPDERVLATEVRLSCTQGMLMMLSREERLALVLVCGLSRYSTGDHSRSTALRPGEFITLDARARSRPRVPSVRGARRGEAGPPTGPGAMAGGG